MLRPIVIFSALVLPSIALAQCPASGALYQGVTLTFDNGDIDTFYSGVDGIVVNKGESSDGEQTTNWTIQLIAGVFEATVHKRTSGYWRPTEAFWLDYDFDVRAGFPLTAGDVGGGVQTLSEDDFSEPATYSYSVHATNGVTIGDCTYETLDIYQTYLLPNSEFGTARMIYIPELEFGYLAETSWTSGITESRIAVEIVQD